MQNAPSTLSPRWLGALVIGAFLVGALLLIGRPEPASALDGMQRVTDQLTCTSGCNQARQLCCGKDEPN